MCHCPHEELSFRAGSRSVGRRRRRRPPSSRWAKEREKTEAAALPASSAHPRRRPLPAQLSHTTGSAGDYKAHPPSTTCSKTGSQIPSVMRPRAATPADYFPGRLRPGSAHSGAEAYFHRRAVVPINVSVFRFAASSFDVTPITVASVAGKGLRIGLSPEIFQAPPRTSANFSDWSARSPGGSAFPEELASSLREGGKPFQVGAAIGRARPPLFFGLVAAPPVARQSAA